METLKNAWYMAGWSEEIAEGRLLERQIARNSLVMSAARTARSRRWPIAAHTVSLRFMSES